MGRDTDVMFRRYEQEAEERRARGEYTPEEQAEQKLARDTGLAMIGTGTICGLVAGIDKTLETEGKTCITGGSIILGQGVNNYGIYSPGEALFVGGLYGVGTAIITGFAAGILFAATHELFLGKKNSSWNRRY